MAAIAGHLEPNPPPESIAPRGVHRSGRWPIVLICLCGAAAYATSFRGVLLFDDLEQIVNNPAIRSLWPPWKDGPGSSRPVVTWTFALNYAFSGLAPWSYHAFNLAIHLLAACTLYGLLRRTLIRLGPNSFPPARATRFATLIAILWTIHPLQTQSVTYIIQRCESMMGLFYLLTFYALCRSADGSRAGLWQALAVLSCAAGMGCKGVMITAPLVGLFYDRVFLSPSFAASFRRRGWMYLGLASTWALLYSFGVIQGTLVADAGQRTTVGFGFKGISPLMYAATEAVVILHYLRLAVWPHSLCLDYAWPVARSLDGIFSSIVAVLILLYATAWAMRRNPPLGFLGVWFLLILSPTSSFIPIQDPAFEHRMYLPLAAVLAAAVLAADALGRRLHRRGASQRALRRLGWTAAVVAVSIFGTLTFARNRYYQDDGRMWADVIRQRPRNARAQYNLGVILVERAEYDRAAARMEEALRLDPTIYMAADYLGVHRALQGRIEQAAYCFRAALIVRPDLHETRVNLGLALAMNGDLLAAERELREVLRSSPNHPNARRHLAEILERRGSAAGRPPLTLIEPATADARLRLRARDSSTPLQP